MSFIYLDTQHLSLENICNLLVFVSLQQKLTPDGPFRKHSLFVRVILCLFSVATLTVLSGAAVECVNNQTFVASLVFCLLCCWIFSCFLQWRKDEL
jgi:hypothetical protein